MPEFSQHEPGTFCYVELTTNDPDATSAKAAELGGTVVMGPMDVMEYGRMSVLADPAGAVLDRPGASSYYREGGMGMRKFDFTGLGITLVVLVGSAILITALSM